MHTDGTQAYTKAGNTPERIAGWIANLGTLGTDLLDQYRIVPIIQIGAKLLKNSILAWE